MEDYIDGRRHEGTLDSEGAFTMDRLSGLRLTLASALPTPNFYLLQTCQGLLAGGAASVEVAVGRAWIRIEFEDPKQTFRDVDGYVSQMFSGLALSSSSPVDLLLTGMATAIGSDIVRAELVPANSHSAFAVSADGVEVVNRPSRKDDSSKARSSVSFFRPPAQGLTFAWSRLWGGKEEEGILQEHFEHSNPGIKVAGLLTSPSGRWRESIEPAGRAGPLVLLEAAVLGPQGRHRAHDFHAMEPVGVSGTEAIPLGLNAKVLDVATLRGVGPRLRDDRVARCLFRKAFDEQGRLWKTSPKPEDWSRRVWTFYFTSQPTDEAMIQWVRFGRSLEKTYHDLGLPGLIVIAPAEGLDVDAGGSSVVSNAKLEATLNKARELVRTLRRSLGPDEVKQLFARTYIQETAAGQGCTVEQELGDLFQAFSWLR